MIDIEEAVRSIREKHDAVSAAKNIYNVAQMEEVAEARRIGKLILEQYTKYRIGDTVKNTYNRRFYKITGASFWPRSDFDAEHPEECLSVILEKTVMKKGYPKKEIVTQRVRSICFPEEW